jgi:putative glycerol-1-phosphate prenyltransferase
MKNNIYKKILTNYAAKRKMIAILLDPDHCTNMQLDKIISILKTNTPDFIFVGGSHAVTSTDNLIETLKAKLNTDIVLFPGNASQFSDKADALLFLSLISGRNAEFLIGQHVNSALEIKKSGIEVIPTAYILIEGGKTSSVEYMSNTRPIPHDKKSIALSTAIAGELLGMQLVYLEAGSGANMPVGKNMIQFVRKNLSVPLIVGGGIKTLDNLESAFNAGADIVVIGNAFESNPEKIEEFVRFCSDYKTMNL